MLVNRTQIFGKEDFVLQEDYFCCLNNVSFTVNYNLSLKNNEVFCSGAALQGGVGVWGGGGGGWNTPPPLLSQSANCYLSRQNWIG